MKAIFMQKLFIKKLNSVFSDVHKICTSSDAYHIAKTFWDLDSLSYTESFYALYLSQSAVPICYALISTGGISGTYVDMKVLLSHALNSGASKIVVFHNHPSGNLKPSPQDIDLTAKIKQACKVCDLSLLDHLILNPEGGFMSMSDTGIL
jgi:DNA repair protein RadC